MNLYLTTTYILRTSNTNYVYVAFIFEYILGNILFFEFQLRDIFSMAYLCPGDYMGLSKSIHIMSPTDLYKLN